MKKFLVPSLLVLFAAGLGQQNAKAGGFSIGISIGDNHRYQPPPVVVAPPPPAVVVSRPPVVYAPAQEVCAPAPAPVVVVQPRPVEYSGYYVREYEHRPVYYGHGHDRYRYDHRRDGYRR